MSRLRSEFDAHQSIVAALDARRQLERSKAAGPRRSLALFSMGAATGAALALVWIGAYLIGS